jgi:hypothetical protein
MQDKRTEFLKKLHELLEEYNVSIDAGYEGDTHGIHGEHISINHRPFKDSFKEYEWLRLDYQITLTAYDLKEELE